MNLRPWLWALASQLVISGVVRWTLLASGSLQRYFWAISSSLFVALLAAVVIAVWQERMILAGSFVVLSSTLVALLFYRKELLQQPLIAQLLVGVGGAVAGLLAALGCQLRRRLRAMD